MRRRRDENRKKGMTNAEKWMYEKLEKTGLEWTFQVIWGWRIFYCWNDSVGIAIEVGGPEHDRSIERKRDAYNYKRSRIVVFRVPNYNEKIADKVIKAVNKKRCWMKQRLLAGVATKKQPNCWRPMASNQRD